MKLYFQKGIKSNKDIEEIHLLDRMTYSEKYLLDIDDYKKSCKEYNGDSLYMLINAKNMDNKITTYKIPLKLENSCSN